MPLDAKRELGGLVCSQSRAERHEALLTNTKHCARRPTKEGANFDAGLQSEKEFVPLG